MDNTARRTFVDLRLRHHRRNQKKDGKKSLHTVVPVVASPTKIYQRQTATDIAIAQSDLQVRMIILFRLVESGRF
ncbi:MAG: hypothetical protein IJJ28_06370, partial [Lentisphaeria bacterium]|nr:hypothetical protein [Lentisphaeria bacterium]